MYRMQRKYEHREIAMLAMLAALAVGSLDCRRARAGSRRRERRAPLRPGKSRSA